VAARQTLAAGFSLFKIDRQHVTHGAPPMAGKPGHAK